MNSKKYLESQLKVFLVSSNTISRSVALKVRFELPPPHAKITPIFHYVKKSSLEVQDLKIEQLDFML